MVGGRREQFDDFEWDERKSTQTLLARGFDFNLARKVFSPLYFEEQVRRANYGEPRYQVIGEVDGSVVVVVWTPRRRCRQIISIRVASRRERREYREKVIRRTGK